MAAYRPRPAGQHTRTARAGRRGTGPRGLRASAGGMRLERLGGPGVHAAPGHGELAAMGPLAGPAAGGGRMSTADATRLLGSWRLQSFRIVYADGNVVHPLGADAVGLLAYTPAGYMSGHL